MESRVETRKKSGEGSSLAPNGAGRDSRTPSLGEGDQNDGVDGWCL